MNAFDGGALRRGVGRKTRFEGLPAEEVLGSGGEGTSASFSLSEPYRACQPQNNGNIDTL